jgi:hypothetical protein
MPIIDLAVAVAVPSSVPSSIVATFAKRMKRDDEADEMQLRNIIAGYYRLVLNNPPEKGYRAHDKFPGWEGDDGVINHIQQYFGLDQGSRKTIK